MQDRQLAIFGGPSARMTLGGDPRSKQQGRSRGSPATTTIPDLVNMITIHIVAVITDPITIHIVAVITDPITSK